MKKKFATPRDIRVQKISIRTNKSPQIIEECIKNIGLEQDSAEEKEVLIRYLNHFDENANKKIFTPASLQNQIYQKCSEVFKLAESLYPVKMEGTEILLINMGKKAGLAKMQGEKFTLVVNPRYNHNALLEEVIPHEVAHLVCMKLKTDFGHGPDWKRTAISLGSSGKTYYGSSPTVFKGKTYRYTDTDGRYVYVSQNLHKKIQAGQTRITDEGTYLTNKCQYVIENPQ